MTSKEALKRLKQETAPATYMADFDKDECIEVIRNDLERLDKLENAIKILNNNFRFVLGVSCIEGKYSYSLERLFSKEYFKITQEDYELLEEML